MIVEYIRYRIAEPDTKAFLHAYEEARASLEASPHCLAYELSRCEEAAESFILRIEWDSVDGHLQGFRKSPEFKPFFVAVKPFVTAIEEMRHYTRTPLAWRRAS